MSDENVKQYTPMVGIVTGAGRGMGRMCATRVADLVDRLLVVDRDGPAVEAAADALAEGNHRAKVEAVQLDVTDVAAITALAARVRELGTLRAMVNAAGISPTMADWRRIFEVDLVGSALLAEKLGPLATDGTSFVYFASMAPILMIPEPVPAADAAIDEPQAENLLDRLHDVVGPGLEDSGLAYAWAKHGVHRLARREAVRLGRVGARVNSVSPGLNDTPQGRQEAQKYPLMEQMVSQTPLGRMGQPAEAAALVAFLISDEASFISGIDVLVDGGLVAALQTQVTGAV